MRHCARFTEGSNGRITCVIYRIDRKGQLDSLAISSGNGRTRAAALTSAYDAVEDETVRLELREGVLEN